MKVKLFHDGNRPIGMRQTNPYYPSHNSAPARRYIPAPLVAPPAYPASGTGLPGRTAIAVGLFLLLTLISLPFCLVGVYYTYFQISGRILPGVHVGGSQLGGKTSDEAAAQLYQDWNLKKHLQITDGIQTVQIAPAELGLSVDPLGIVQSAYEVGHGQSILAEIDQMVYSLTKGWGIAPVVDFDAQAAAAGLQALDGSLNRPAKNASILLDGDQLVAMPAEIGYAINHGETLAALAADPRGVMINGGFQVVLQPVIPAISDVTPFLEEGERLLSSPRPVRAYDPVTDEWMEWTPARQDVASWMVAGTREDGAPALSLDESRMTGFLEGLSASLGAGRWLDLASRSGSLEDLLLSEGAAPLLVRHAPTTYTVQPGDTLIKIGWNVGVPYWRILEANPGVDAESIYTGQVLNIPSKDDLLPLPVVSNKRIVISISQQRLWTYQDRALRSEHVISTGIDRSPTQPGVFQIQTHEVNAYASVWDLHMPHFMGIYESWPGFINGIHGLPTLSNGNRLWANILGRPASYGCIILDLDAAEDLFNWAEEGVVVEIQP